MSLSFSNAKTSYTATSSLVYSIGFTYENQSEVKVRTQLASGAYQEVTNWTFLGTTSIQFTSTPPTTFEIYRVTDISRSYGTPGYAVFRAGSQLNAGDLNKNFELLRRGIEENFTTLSGLLFEDNQYFDDTYVNAAGDKMTGDLNVGTSSSNRITLRIDGSANFEGKITSPTTLSTDGTQVLTTKNYVDSSISTAVAAVPGTNLGYDTASRIISSSTGTDITLPLAYPGTISGLLTGADKAKIDGIETGATADQTDAEIKTAYENNADTNAYTDAEKTKLAGIETAATADQTDAEIKTAYENNADTNAYTDAEKTKLAGIETAATADQTGAEIKALYEVEANAFTDAQFTKLAGIETAATADQTDAEIKTAYENNADTNAFTDAEKTKLSGIAAGAEVNTVTSVNTATGAVVLDADDIDDASTAHKFVTASDVTALGTLSSDLAGKADLSGGKLDTSQLPDIAISEYKGAVANQTAMLAVTGEKGDWVTRTDDGKVYVITGTNPSVIGDWTALSYPTAPDTDLSYDSSTRVLASSTGTDATLPEVVAAGDSGLMTGADKTKLDGIESGATADQTGAEIKTAYEGEADTNAFTDAEKTKLSGIESGATADQTDAEIKTAYENNADTNAFTDAEQTKLAGIATGAQVNVATDLTYTASTRLLESSTGTDVTLPEVTAGGDSGLITGADKTKLDGIETGATADQTAAEILTAIKTVDGATSGLDSDLLDGQHGSHYLDYNNFTNTPTIPTNNNQLTNGAGYITSADGGNAGTLDGIDSSQFLRSDASDTWSGDISTTSTNGIRFGSSNQTDSNDGYIAAGRFSSGLNIVGTQTTSGTGRQIRLWGSLITDNGSTYWHSGNDGAGSGLDADNLDGYTWTSSGKNLRGTEIYADNWFRNYNSGEGIYNEANAMYWYSDDNTTWRLRGNQTNVKIRFATASNTTRGYLYADTAPSIGFLNTGHQWGLRYLSNDGNSPNLYWREEGNETWTGNPGNDCGKIEYHSNRFYIASGANSSEIVRFRHSGTDRVWIQNSGNIQVNGNNVWHAGNDGSGSGLDADLLDGQQGSYYSDYNNLSNKIFTYTTNRSLHSSTARATTGYDNFFAGCCAGGSSTGNYHIAIGCAAGASISGGSGNILLGRSAGCSLTGNGNNQMIGQYAGCSATGSNNFFVGYYAGRLTTGHSNIFLGIYSGCNNTTGNCNVMIGQRAGNKNVAGNFNIFFGMNAAYCYRNGDRNIIMGCCSGYKNYDADNNIYLGPNAAKCGTSAYRNISIGDGSGYYMSTGNGNSIMGYIAGFRNSSGSGNVYIGCAAGCCASTGSNNIAIGCNAANQNGGLYTITTASNQIVLGNTSHTSSRVNVDWTIGSDCRDKCIYGAVPHGRTFLRNINTIEYALKDRVSGCLKDVEGCRRYGFSAQNLLEAEGENPVIVDTENPDKLLITSSYIVPIVVNAVNELSEEIDDLKARLVALETS